MMKKCNWIICILGVFIILSGTVFAADKSKSDLPWEKAYLTLGWFFADTNSAFLLGESNIGLGVDGLRVNVEANGSDYPGVDFKGTVEFDYFGAQLYVKVFL